MKTLLMGRMAIVLATFTALAGLSVPATARTLIEIIDFTIEPLPVAVPMFIPEGGGESAQYADQIARVVVADLVSTGLFREIPREAYISGVSSFDAPIAYPDWKAINAQGLVTGSVSVGGDGTLVVKFRVFDIFGDEQMGEGLQFAGTTTSWRRMAHKVADQVYSRMTGEGGYFDSRIVFVSETGPKDAKQKRLAVMDSDGASVQYLTDGGSIVLGPRFSPTGDRIVYTSYESGEPQIMLMDLASLSRRPLLGGAEGMSVAPSFSPDGGRAVYSVAKGGNSDLYIVDIASGQERRLTDAPSIETAPSFSPDGSQIVFESDRSGNQQLYVMSTSGGEARRISGGSGRYGTPVWSPRGDYIAFTKQNEGRFHIGVMLVDGSEERLLSASFLDEGPTWAPNGRVIMFTRVSQGAEGAASLYAVDISGRNLHRIATETGASDPAWSPLLP